VKQRKSLARQQRRQKAWDNTRYAKTQGFKRPGSNKKPFPKGKR
jgi:hypothetical protein